MFKLLLGPREKQLSPFLSRLHVSAGGAVPNSKTPQLSGCVGLLETRAPLTMFFESFNGLPQASTPALGF